MSALNKSNAALKVMPTRRKGRRRSHTMGNRIKASRASGQQRMNRMIHNRNLAMIEPPRLVFFYEVHGEKVHPGR
jgi:hypothetical protein